MRQQESEMRQQEAEIRQQETEMRLTAVGLHGTFGSLGGGSSVNCNCQKQTTNGEFGEISKYLFPEYSR